MPPRTDGWALLTRIAARPEEFGCCETTAALAAQLLLRTQLIQGAICAADVRALTEVVGEAAMLELIENLAGYEAVRILGNLEGFNREPRGADAARRALADIARGGGDGGGDLRTSATAFVAARTDRALTRHKAMGARRLRADATPM
ncbi:MAG: hypothetical protein GC189_13860 [Alphaproteobacteria bacterium]|nr:hypothetical protein [Alphaproteobacteria bacterium]